jgi:DNA mismatch repair protein MutL
MVENCIIPKQFARFVPDKDKMDASCIIYSMPIKLLTDEVASQIAAGEVIERPASVLKELIENAIDAGSTSITIQIHGSGQQLIEVTDDGVGIPVSEMELAITRHATSKLSSAEDLFHIQTLGFRGEALASIGSISHLSISSRSVQSSVGAQVIVEGGRIISSAPVVQTHGTTIRIENLFFNVPARLKFLKKDFTEKQVNFGLLSRYSLAYPDIHFKVLLDDKLVIQTSGSGDRREVIGNLFEPELARQMIVAEGLDHGIKLEGFISPISITRSNRREITFFVNGRWIQDTTLSAAVLQAYHTYLMVGRYPMAVLFLTLPPEDIDVNVHPAKSEVKFRSPEQVFSIIQRSIRIALLSSSPVPEMQSTNSYWQSNQPVQKLPDPAWDMAGEINQKGQNPDENQSIQNSTQISPQSQGFGGIPLLRLVGQVGAAYLVAEAPNGLYLIDQHAAHERVLYEQYIRQKDKRLVSQQLLEPVSVQLTISQAELLIKQIPILGHLGFDVEEFGATSFLIRAIPAVFSGLQPASALKVLVEDFEEDETPLQHEVEAKIIARVCKRAAIKAGQVLSGEEQRQLLADLESCFSPRTCPHGRPTMIHLSVDLLERQFGRKGAR